MAEIVWNAGLLTEAEALCAAARGCASRGWLPATAGNFSFRAAGRSFISRSGLDKGAMTPSDLLEIDADCTVVAGNGRPSAETLLHGAIYRRFADAGAIFHVHTIWNTLLSEICFQAGSVLLEDYELLKALRGVETHATREWVPIVDNSQEYVGLTLSLERALDTYPGAHGVLLRRHGLYTWGESVAEARRHVEALEFLFEVEWRLRTKF